MRRAIAGAARTNVPEPLTWSGDEVAALAWMSPDELLLIAPAAAAAEAAERLRAALDGVHALVLDVSAMRAGLRVTGPAARATLAKLAPADLSARAFGPRAFRRTRVAQVPAALRATGAGIEVLAFRSHAAHVAQLLHGAATRGPVAHLMP